jgi:hypothetical protein
MNTTDKLDQTGLNLYRIFNSRPGCMHSMHNLHCVAKLPSLELDNIHPTLLQALVDYKIDTWSLYYKTFYGHNCCYIRHQYHHCATF